MNIRPLLLSMTYAVLYLVTCALIGTGLLLELRMDEEDGAERLFGMSQDDWGEIHFVVAITFAALAVLHLVQNWAWIKSAVRRSRPALVLVTVGLVLVAGLLLWPTTSAHATWSDQLRHTLTDD